MAMFFNEKDESKAMSEANLLKLKNVTPFFNDEEGREVVQIDDMLFVVRDLTFFGFSGTRWTNGQVYYEFDSNVNNSNKAKFLAACQEWSNVADLNFIERTTQSNYIHVQSDSVNESYVGMIGRKQVMKIYNWNWKFIIVHEIGHALGLSHEHSRSDRDTYVRINFSNIISGTERNFFKDATTNYTSYDFASIMHYGQYAFSKNNLPTIEAQSGYEHQEQYMGNRLYMTSLDAAGMAARYGIPKAPGTRQNAAPELQAEQELQHA